MGQEFITSKEKFDIKDLVMSHLKEILSISRKEFRPAHKQITEVNGIKTEATIDDNRLCYIQAVESLSDILSPHYDKETDKTEKTILEDIEQARLKCTPITEEQYIKTKFNLMRKLFRQINFLLKKRDYLAGVTFIEESDDIENKLIGEPEVEEE